MPGHAALLDLLPAVHRSCAQLEAHRLRMPLHLGPLVRQRRRMCATLRAVLRWHGVEMTGADAEHPADLPLSELCRAERRLVALYDAAIADAADDAPELRLLNEQRAETARAQQELFALLRADGQARRHPVAWHSATAH